MEQVRRGWIAGKDITIPIDLWTDGSTFEITVDGVSWLNVESQMHAVVLFEMMKDHLTEYVRYERKR